MIKIFQEVFQYRDLLWMLTLRDLRVRYKQAVMGFVWAIFMPIIAILAGIIIKKAMAVVSHRPLEMEGIISISVKVLPWTFFVSSIRFAVQSLVGNSALITKIYFPRAVLPLSATLACFFDFGVALVVLTLLLSLFKIGISVYILWLPLYVILLVVFTSGLGLFLAAANLFFRDVKYVVEIILMFGIFFTPVFYEASAFARWSFIMLLNPIGSILEGINRVVVHHQSPELFWLGYAILTSVSMFLIGATLFRRSEPLFAENI